MADALASLLRQSEVEGAEAASREGTSQYQAKEEGDPTEIAADLGEFEDLAQDWLASVYVSAKARCLALASLPVGPGPSTCEIMLTNNRAPPPASKCPVFQDIQFTLRKAIRFLVLASQPPVLTASHSFVPGGGVSAASAGRASSQHLSATGKVSKITSTNAPSQNGTSASAVEGQGRGNQVKELEPTAELSLSALKIQHQAWKDLLTILQKMKEQHEHQQNGHSEPQDQLQIVKVFEELLRGDDAA